MNNRDGGGCRVRCTRSAGPTADGGLKRAPRTKASRQERGRKRTTTNSACESLTQLAPDKPRSNAHRSAAILHATVAPRWLQWSPPSSSAALSEGEGGPSVPAHCVDAAGVLRVRYHSRVALQKEPARGGRSANCTRRTPQTPTRLGLLEALQAPQTPGQPQARDREREQSDDNDPGHTVQHTSHSTGFSSSERATVVSLAK